MTKQDLIRAAKLAYYNTDTPVMTDEQYDRLVAEVGEESVGAPVLDSIEKIEIKGKPMLSLNKCHTEEEIIEFAKGQDLIASIKCDGLSVRLIYEGGNLISANTRGDGEIGANITEHIKQFMNVPLAIDTKEKVVVDGEAVILQHDFDEINKNGEFKNPRNLAAGTLASLDTSLCKSRRLSFIAWDLIEPKMNLYNEGLNFLEDQCFFNIVTWQYCLASSDNYTYKNINDKIMNIAKEQGIPCDGVVWKYNNLDFDNTRTAHHFNNGIAWKPAIEEHETRLKHIEWSLGRTGILTPVAIFEPIDIDGSIVERASLHNYSIMKEIMGDCCYCGQKIKVFKANMIIPQISSAIKMSYGDVISHGGVTCDGFSNDYGLTCPICNGETEIKNNDGVETIWCTNPNCEGKIINIIDHFVGKKGLDVKGLSKATIEKLIDNGWLNRRADIFELYKFKAEWEKLPGFGVKSVSNILKAISDAKNCNLESYIASLGIPLIGRTVSKELSKRFKSYDEFRKAIKDEKYDFSNIDGFGYEMNKSLKEYDYAEADEIAKLLSIQERPDDAVAASEQTVTGKTFVITGKCNLGSRDKVKEIIESHGGKVGSSVSSKTDYLVCNIPENTTKYTKAQSLGIPIITEEELLKLLK